MIVQWYVSKNPIKIDIMSKDTDKDALLEAHQSVNFKNRINFENKIVNNCRREA